MSVVVPCYNEEATLVGCIESLLRIQDAMLNLEIIIVDDASTDNSFALARSLESKYSEICVLAHDRNKGKGAALRTGFARAMGEIVAVQDADLEYDPLDLRRLVRPILEDKADVVIGSRFISTGEHRVLYFWHSLGNRCLTFLSNMFSDLNLTDMETCYKVFKREVIQSINIQEDRFGFEPEIVAKVAAMRVRIYEQGISYYGRTYEEGKKIGWKDGLRALYCIFHYNAPKTPLPIQIAIYCCIGGISAVFNLLVFLGLLALGIGVPVSASLAYALAAISNYLLCITFLFRHKARWSSIGEIVVYTIVVLVSGIIDVALTSALSAGMSPAWAKMSASVVVLVINFYGRKRFVFPDKSAGEWKPQSKGHTKPTV
jgi:glycosyltransferase involved in cell wall biosynthesis